MDATLASGIIGAAAGVIGAGVGGGATLLVGRIGALEQAREAHRTELRNCCSEFTAAIARARSNSYSIPDNKGADDAAFKALEDARVSGERLRLLSSDKRTQKAARLAIRHVYAVIRQAQTGIDPRADEFPGRGPHKRLREELTTLYIGVRRELGISNPEAVFEDLEN